MLIQFPIWMAMFFFVPNAIQLRRESFMWMDDLSTYDPIIEWGTNIWGIGDHLSLTCILFCVANVLYSYMTMRQQKDQMVGQQAEQMKMMQWMMYLMPIMFFFMFNDYSSGLNFYYFDPPQDHQRRKAPRHPRSQVQGEQEQPDKEDQWPCLASCCHAEAG